KKNVATPAPTLLAEELLNLAPERTKPGARAVALSPSLYSCPPVISKLVRRQLRPIPQHLAAEGVDRHEPHRVVGRGSMARDNSGAAVQIIQQPARERDALGSRAIGRPREVKPNKDLYGRRTLVELRCRDAASGEDCGDEQRHRRAIGAPWSAVL